MSTPLAPATNPFEVFYYEFGTYEVIDNRDGKLITSAYGRDEAQAKADQLWYAELKAIAPIVSQGNRLWNSDLGAYEDVEIVVGRSGQQSAKSYGYSA